MYFSCSRSTYEFLERLDELLIGVVQNQTIKDK